MNAILISSEGCRLNGPSVIQLRAPLCSFASSRLAANSSIASTPAATRQRITRAGLPRNQIKKQYSTVPMATPSSWV